MYNMTVYFCLSTRSISLLSVKKALKCLVNILNIKKSVKHKIFFFVNATSPPSQIFYTQKVE